MGKMITYGSLTRTDGMKGKFVQISEVLLHTFLRSSLPQVEIDERFYRATYGDVDAAIRDGRLSSASEHYIAVGYFEGRLPRQILVDEQWYLYMYPDVAEAVKSGTVESAQAHFDKEGFKEGRLPYDGWTL